MHDIFISFYQQKISFKTQIQTSPNITCDKTISEWRLFTSMTFSQGILQL